MDYQIPWWAEAKRRGPITVEDLDRAAMAVFGKERNNDNDQMYPATLSHALDGLKWWEPAYATGTTRFDPPPAINAEDAERAKVVDFKEGAD